MGAVFKIPAFLIYVIGGIWGFILCAGIIHVKFGFLGALVAFIIFPFTFALVPWYAGIADGNWFPLALNYGSVLAGGVLFAIGSAIDRD